MLAFEVKLTAASGNAGCYYWAHDIGGFRGDPNPELTVRWTQFGALSAALRVHSTKDARLDRRPWISGERETAAMRRMYHMRSELMPYIYSSVWQTHSTMVSLNRPMYIDYGSDERAYENEQEFLFGDILLAAPIASPGEGADKTASQKVWFPAGDVWYDYFTHERFDGGRNAASPSRSKSSRSTSGAVGCCRCSLIRRAPLRRRSRRSSCAFTPRRAMPTIPIRSTRTTA